MTNFIIAADSACDLPIEYTSQNNVKILNGRYFLRGREYIENENNLSPNDFYREIKEGNACSYSFINVTALKEFFCEYLKEGKDILFISASSKNSKTYSCALTAAQIAAEDFPKNKVYVLDSKSISAGEGLVVDFSVKMRKKGAGANETYENLLKITEKLESFVACGGIDYFVANKRLPKVSNVFFKNSIPIFSFNENGEFTPIVKAKNKQHAINFLLEQLFKDELPRENEIYISHGNCPGEALAFSNLIKEKQPAADIKTLCAGAALGSIVGADSLGIFFIKK